MIALDRDLPQTCADCPCYQTLHVYGLLALEPNILMHRCAANGEIINTMGWREGDPAPPDEWYDFTKPEWCPWINYGE